MRRRHPALVVLLACVALLAGRAADAQNPPRPHPLLALLALTPDAPFVSRGAPFLRYTDYRALREAGLSATCPPGESDERDWFAELPAQPSFALARLGFNPLAVERALAFGESPASGVILEGEFDAAAISAALDARGYTQRDEQGILIAQPPGGPRREQIAQAGRYLMMTLKATLLDDLVNAYIGYQQSLYSEPAVLALAEALAHQPGELLSAAFFDAGRLPRSLAAIVQRRSGGPAALAVYRDGGQGVTLLALVEGDRNGARWAARTLARRLRDGGAVVQAPTVYQGAGGYFVALARARAQQVSGGAPTLCAL